MNKRVLSSFSSEQLDCLIHHFRLTMNVSEHPALSIPSTELLDEAKCSAFVHRLEAVFPEQSAIVKASMFAKRYSFLIIASSLYSMSMFNKALDYSIENCYIESMHQGEIWLPKVRVADWHVTEPEEGGREKWREAVVASIFAGNIAKVWGALSKAANIPSTVLWENTAVYVYWLYEKRIGEEADEQQKSRICEDFQYLLHRAPASVFGTAENPIAKFNSAKCGDSASGQPIRYRKTCCYYYQTSPDQTCCSTCPRNHSFNIHRE